MKISDFILRYPTNNIYDGICRTRIFINQQFEVCVVLTEIKANVSASITNSVESIYNYLKSTGTVEKIDFLFEHNEESALESFDLVSIENGIANWESITKDVVINKCESKIYEFDITTSEDMRLMDEIEKLRIKINPRYGLHYPEESSFVLRKREIISKQISKQSIRQLIEARAGENEIQNLLKKDLSIFAEIYARHEDQYHCFSEFPVGDGFVDFALFTGVSRMDIFLIEVKGANFNLVNKTGYRKFSGIIETAMDQIRNRIAYIHEHSEEFRIKAHQIRGKIESGERLYNSFTGAIKNLEVDPNKKINIYPVVIGGITTDDLSESNKRHEYEQRSSPKVNVESWNSWLKKVRRE